MVNSRSTGGSPMGDAALGGTTPPYRQWDVVVVPFPFADGAHSRRRPALAISSSDAFGSKIGHTVFAMITSAHNAPWPLDVAISDLEAAGLPAPSVVRMKLFTLDERFILKKAGVLGPADSRAVGESLAALLGLRVVSI